MFNKIKFSQPYRNYRWPVIDFVSVLCATSGILIDGYLREVERRMPLMQSSFRLAAITAASFQQDNNFPYKSTGSRFGISNCFHLLTSSGEVCLASGMPTKSHKMKVPYCRWKALWNSFDRRTWADDDAFWTERRRRNKETKIGS